MALKLHELPDQQANRAIEVALVQNHSIRFVGTGLAKNYADWCENRGLKAMATQRCPCGNLGNSRKYCSCTLGQQLRYYTKNFKDKYDLEITVEDKSEQIYKLLVGELKLESENEILKRVKDAQKLLKNVKEKLSSDVKMILQQGIIKMNLDFQQSKTLLSLTKSITALNRDTVIKPHYLAEALQYMI